MLCLSETWLKPEEIHVIDSIVNNCDELSQSQVTVFAKSSMVDLDGAHRGRPFGGMALICKHSADRIYDEIPVMTERIQSLKVCDATGHPVQVLCSVYLPHYSADSTPDFIETLDELQSLIDTYASLCPIKVLGDFNVQLPKSCVLSKHWERAQGFTVHSKIMYNFLASNDMHVSLCVISV